MLISPEGLARLRTGKCGYPCQMASQPKSATSQPFTGPNPYVNTAFQESRLQPREMFLLIRLCLRDVTIWGGIDCASPFLMIFANAGVEPALSLSGHSFAGERGKKGVTIYCPRGLRREGCALQDAHFIVPTWTRC